MLETLGADVRLTPQEEGFEGPIERRDRYRGRPGYYVPDQFANPDNARCHELTTGAELIEQLQEQGAPELQAFVAGVGTGGTLMGVGRALRKVQPAIQVIAVEPQESNVMSGGSPGDHGIQGIGDGFVPDIIELDEVDRVMCISTAAARAEADRIRQAHGYCVGMSAGANMLVALELANEGLTVATIWPDCSDRYISMGLKSPETADVTCPLRNACRERTAALLSRQG